MLFSLKQVTKMKRQMNKLNHEDNSVTWINIFMLPQVRNDHIAAFSLL